MAAVRARDSRNKITVSAHVMGSGGLAVDAMAIGCLGVERRGERFFVLCHFRSLGHTRANFYVLPTTLPGITYFPVFTGPRFRFRGAKPVEVGEGATPRARARQRRGPAPICALICMASCAHRCSSRAAIARRRGRRKSTPPFPQNPRLPERKVCEVGVKVEFAGLARLPVGA